MSGGWEGTEGVTREVVMAGGRVPLREVIGLNVEVAHLHEPVTPQRRPRPVEFCQPTRVAVSRKEVHIFLSMFCSSLKICFSVLDGEPAAFEYFRVVGTTVLVSGSEWTGERCDLRWNGSQREKEFTGRVAEPHKFAWKLRKYRCL